MPIRTDSAFSEGAISEVGVSGSTDGTSSSPGDRVVVLPFTSRVFSVRARSRIVDPLEFDRSVSVFAQNRVIKLPAF